MHKRISCSIVEEPVGCSFVVQQTFSDTFKHIYQCVYDNTEVNAVTTSFLINTDKLPVRGLS